MYKSRILSSAAVAALLLTVPVSLPASVGLLPDAAVAQSRTDIDVNFFFGELEPHGSWVRHERHRYVFVPDRVAVDWAPYTQGRWVYLESVGWTFVSEERHSWATYHYGRWGYDRQIGWFWVPGTKWAPAWVSWRRSPDHIGWAPLPPEGDGFAISLEVNVRDIPEDRWLFVPANQFLAPQLHVVLIPVRERPILFQRTEYLGPVIVQNNIVVNTVINIDFVRERTGREVEVRRLETVQDPDQALTTGEGDTLAVFAPEVAEPTADAAPAEVVEVEQVVEQLKEQGVTPAAGAETDATAGAGATTETEAGATTETEADATTETEAGATTSGDAATEAPATDAAESEAEAETGTEAETSTEAPAAAETEAPVEAEADAAVETEAAPAARTAAPEAEAEVEAEATTEADSASEPAASEAPAAETEAPAEADAPAEAEAPAASEAPAEAPAAETEAPAETEQPAAEQPATQEAPAQPCTAERQAQGLC